MKLREHGLTACREQLVKNISYPHRMIPMFIPKREGTDRIMDKIRRGVPCYFENSKSGIAIKFVPPDDLEFYAKPRVGNEYRIKRKSRVVIDAYLEGNEITAEEYDNYNQPRAVV